MSKIVALDFGMKRIGVAITDDLNIIASGLDTVSNENIISFLEQPQLTLLLKPFQSAHLR